MSRLFAFLRHVAAFTLVGALAVEFILIGQIQTKNATTGEGLSVPVVRRLVIADAVLGAAA